MRTAVKAALSTSFCVLFASGCGVQQGQYDSMLRSYNALKEDNVRLTGERDAAQSNLETVSGDLADARQHVRSLSDRNSDMRGDLSTVAGNYDKLIERVSTLDLAVLPPDVEMALEDLAVRNPQMLGFDPNKGMVQFASDFTFALGSVEIQPQAAESLTTLAAILNTDNAMRLEVQVVGHTDNVPIGRPETRRKHATNMHLSVHRAIAVREVLMSAGIEPARIEVSGYGEHRPVAVNGIRGSAANRRVEIFLVPMQAVTAAEAPSASQETATAEPMK